MTLEDLIAEFDDMGECRKCSSPGEPSWEWECPCGKVEALIRRAYAEGVRRGTEVLPKKIRDCRYGGNHMSDKDCSDCGWIHGAKQAIKECGSAIDAEADRIMGL